MPHPATSSAPQLHQRADASGRFSGSGWPVGLLVAGGLVSFDPAGWQIFGPVKWLVVTVVAWMAAGLSVSRGVELHRGSALVWSVFLGWAAVTSLTALDPLAAWLGTPDRRFGIVTLATMAVAFVAGQAVDDAAGRRILGRWVVAALLSMTAYGLLEATGMTPVDLTTTTSRLGSTLGSPAYLGAAVCLLTPIAFGLASSGGETTGWRWVAAAAGVGGFFLLAGSGTRAALVGMVAAGVVALSTRPFPGRRAGLALGVAAVVVGLGLSPLGSRVLEGETSGRLDEWRVALEATSNRPIVGTGLEGYRIAFPSHVSSDYVRAHGRETVTDRAHSGPLDMAVATGIVGGAAWLAAAMWLTARAWRFRRLSDPLVVGMGAGVVALVVQELFLFPTVEVGVGGWAVAGAVVAAARPREALLKVRSRPIAVGILAVAVLAAVAGTADVVADHRAAAAVADADLETADRSRELRPDSYRYALLAADVALRDGSPAEALDRVELAALLTEDGPEVRIARARVLGALVASGELTPGVAAAELEGMVRADPHHPELRLIHGGLLASAGAADEAELAWLAAEHLAPADPEPPLRLAALYLTGGHRDLASQALDRARRLDPRHPDLARLGRALD